MRSKTDKIGPNELRYDTLIQNIGSYVIIFMLSDGQPMWDEKINVTYIITPVSTSYIE